MATNNKSGKGLGTGLGALFGDAADAVPNDFEYIPITKIEPNRAQPRVAFEREPLEELASSIREHGVLSPLTVRPIGGGFYQIIAGERRWRAAREAGLTELPARVLDVDDRAAMELSLVENLQRENLNPVEEAMGYRALSDEFGLTQEEISLRMGKSRPVIANALRLLTLPEEIIELTRAGKLAVGSARALASIRDEDTMIEAAREIAKHGLSAREAERFARKLNKRPNAAKAEKVEKVNYLSEFETSLSQALGRRVRITGGARNNGRIEIEYYGDEDFERLVNGLYSLGEESV
ncbi:MAG: ParB/RepB/Spo0J family partition protein [Oscillospiraceae bacterium]|jgi:ParB family chromosome partitioning protein|nr:ParB/RepB/Spo0J family partition protein [Oscillospiraceae bacterium]